MWQSLIAGEMEEVEMSVYGNRSRIPSTIHLKDLQTQCIVFHLFVIPTPQIASSDRETTISTAKTLVPAQCSIPLSPPLFLTIVLSIHFNLMDSHSSIVGFSGRRVEFKRRSSRNFYQNPSIWGTILLEPDLDVNSQRK